MKKDKVEKLAKKEEKKAQKAVKKARKAEQKAKKGEEKAKKAANKGKKEPKGKKQEGGKPKKSKKKLLIILLLMVLIAAAAVVFLKFRGGGDDSGEEEVVEEEVPEPIEAPKEYTLGELSFPALPVMMNEEALVYLEEPVVPEEEEPAVDEATDQSTEEDAAAEEPVETTAVAYRYEGLKDHRAMITSYANLLSLKDVGFVYVDGLMYETTAPNFGTAEGEAHLVQKAPEEGMIYSVQLRWSEENCIVTVDHREGAIEIPPTPAPVDPMSLSEAYAYFTALAPSDLGLEGTTMDDYHVYTLDGAVLVDGHPCVHLRVYSVTAGGTNEIAGEYFITADKAHIYKRDIDGNLFEVGKE